MDPLAWPLMYLWRQFQLLDYYFYCQMPPGLFVQHIHIKHRVKDWPALRGWIEAKKDRKKIFLKETRSFASSEKWNCSFPLPEGSCLLWPALAVETASVLLSDRQEVYSQGLKALDQKEVTRELSSPLVS